jgi:hypothetical protein
MGNVIYCVLGASLIALRFVYFFFKQVMKGSEGTAIFSSVWRVLSA